MYIELCLRVQLNVVYAYYRTYRLKKRCRVFETRGRGVRIFPGISCRGCLRLTPIGNGIGVTGVGGSISISVVCDDTESPGNGVYTACDGVS